MIFFCNLDKKIIMLINKNENVRKEKIYISILFIRDY